MFKQLQCMLQVYCTIPRLQCQSLADQDRPTPQRTATVLSRPDLVLVNAVSQNLAHRIVDEVYVWTKSGHEVMASFASADRRSPVLDVPEPVPLESEVPVLRKSIYSPRISQGSVAALWPKIKGIIFIGTRRTTEACLKCDMQREVSVFHRFVWPGEVHQENHFRWR